MEEEKAKRKPILLVDFDGVIHLYNSGWQGADVVSDGPVPGAHEESQGWPHAGSGGKGVQWYMPSLHRRLQFPTVKPPAFWTIDDRCTQFTGTFPDPREIRGYRPWTKKGV